MIIEESISIDGPLDIVWSRFSDITCWKEWNTVLEDTGLDTAAAIKAGQAYRWCLRPFSIPIHFEPVVEEVVPRAKVVWRGSKLGIHARHEFFFRESGEKTVVTSRETFRGLTPALTRKLFLGAKVREMTARMLDDLKTTVEAGLEEAKITAETGSSNPVPAEDDQKKGSS